jgi:hypothetical protein
MTDGLHSSSWFSNSGDFHLDGVGGLYHQESSSSHKFPSGMRKACRRHTPVASVGRTPGAPSGEPDSQSPQREPALFCGFPDLSGLAWGTPRQVLQRDATCYLPRGDAKGEQVGKPAQRSGSGTPRQVLQVGIAAVSTWLPPGSQSPTAGNPPAGLVHRNALAPQGAEEGQRTGSPPAAGCRHHMNGFAVLKL